MRYLLQLEGAATEFVPGAFDPHAAFTRELQEAGAFVTGAPDSYVIEVDSHDEAVAWAKRRSQFGGAVDFGVSRSSYSRNRPEGGRT
jgi:hypothetical protein